MVNGLHPSNTGTKEDSPARAHTELYLSSRPSVIVCVQEGPLFALSNEIALKYTKTEI